MMAVVGGYYGMWSHEKQKEYGIFPTPLFLITLFKGSSHTTHDSPLMRVKKNRTFEIEDKPLVPEKYEAALKDKELREKEAKEKKELWEMIEVKEKIELLSREKSQKTFKQLPTQFKKETKFTHMLLKNRE
jgi:hypothetical protein